MNKKIFILIGIFWLVIILGFIAIKEFTLQSGKEVILKTQPVDPRDLFRGDYVVLRYEISRLDMASLQSDGVFSIDDKVYVALDIVDGYAVAEGLYKGQPKQGLFIKGTVRQINANTASVEYGIESYFVPEGRGYEIERARGKLEVKVAIDRYGNSLIKNILIDGKEFTFDRDLGIKS